MHEHLIEAPRGGSPVIAGPQSTVMATVLLACIAGPLLFTGWGGDGQQGTG